MCAELVAEDHVAAQDAPMQSNASPAETRAPLLCQGMKRMKEKDDHGESGYGGSTRGGEHQTGLAKKNRSNALWRHCELYHGGETAEFSMSVVSTTTKPFIRKIREGVEIVAGNQDILMNSKEEFLQGAVPSTRVQRGFGR